MSFRNVLKRLMVLSIPPTLKGEETEKPHIHHDDSLGSLCSPRQANTNIEQGSRIIESICDCGYRPPFCTCDH